MATVLEKPNPSQAMDRAAHRPQSIFTQRVNLSRAERWASILGGSVAAFLGLSRGKLDGLVLAAMGGGLLYRGLTGHCNVYQALGLSFAESEAALHPGEGIRLAESVTILRPASDLYRFWRKLENLPRIMPGLRSVESRGGGRSHWVAEGPTGAVEWDAVIVKDESDLVISWQSVPGSEVDTAGSVHFRAAPGDRGTEVKVVLRYNPPLGKIGAALAWLTSHDPELEVREGLRRFKREMEIGRQPTTEGQPRGTCGH